MGWVELVGTIPNMRSGTVLIRRWSKLEEHKPP